MLLLLLLLLLSARHACLTCNSGSQNAFHPLRLHGICARLTASFTASVMGVAGGPLGSSPGGLSVMTGMTPSVDALDTLLPQVQFSKRCVRMFTMCKSDSIISESVDDGKSGSIDSRAMISARRFMARRRLQASGCKVLCASEVSEHKLN